MTKNSIYKFETNISTSDFKRALSENSLLSASDFDLLRYHYFQPNHGATATQLAIALNYKKYTAVNLHFARIAKRISKYTGKFPPMKTNGKNWWWTLLADGKEDNGFFIWFLRPELVQAMEELQIVENNSLPEQINSFRQNLKEGMSKVIQVNAYERNPVARKKCIEYHKPICKVCGFDFKDKYGELGKGFIHVHHLVPISEIKQNYSIDPIKDLVPICPNCHAMIHRSSEYVLSINDLQEIIKANKIKKKV